MEPPLGLSSVRFDEKSPDAGWAPGRSPRLAQPACDDRKPHLTVPPCRENDVGENTEPVGTPLENDCGPTDGEMGGGRGIGPETEWARLELGYPVAGEAVVWRAWLAS